MKSGSLLWKLHNFSHPGYVTENLSDSHRYPNRMLRQKIFDMAFIALNGLGREEYYFYIEPIPKLKT
jgi:hypothetical protein